MDRNKLLVILLLTLLFSNVFSQTLENKNSTTILENFKKNCWRHDDYWLAKDKIQHFSSSIMIFVTNNYYQDRYTDFSNQAININSYTISLSLGIGKEILDFTGPKRYFSFKDLFADIAGNVAGNILVNVLR